MFLYPVWQWLLFLSEGNIFLLLARLVFTLWGECVCPLSCPLAFRASSWLCPGESVTRAACPEHVSLFGLAKLFFTPGIEVTVTVTHLMSSSRIFLAVLEVPLNIVTGVSEQAGGSRREACESSRVSPRPRWPLPLLTAALGGGSCSLGHQPVQGLRPGVTSSTLSLSADACGTLSLSSQTSRFCFVLLCFFP